MALDYTSTALIADIKRRAMTPTSQATFNEGTDIPGMITSELQGTMVTALTGVREDYFLTYKDYTIDGSTSTFELPQRTINSVVEGIEFYNSSSKSHGRIARVSVNDLAGPYVISNQGAFHIRDNCIVFEDAPTNTSDVLRVYYCRRPNKVVGENKYGRVTAINTGTREVTVNFAPTTWTTSTTFDIIQGRPGFRSLGDDLSISAKTGLILTFSSTLPTDLVVGDYIAEAGESPIPQIPLEGHYVLAQRVACMLIMALGDAAHYKLAREESDRMMNNFLKVIKDRVASHPKKIVPQRGILNYIRAGSRGY